MNTHSVIVNFNHFSVYFPFTSVKRDVKYLIISPYIFRILM